MDEEKARLTREEIKERLLALRDLPYYKDEEVWRIAIVTFSVRQALRVFPLLGREGNFYYWKKAQRLPYLEAVEVSILEALLYTKGSLIKGRRRIQPASVGAYADAYAAFAYAAASAAAFAVYADTATASVDFAASAAAPDVAAADLQILERGGKLIEAPLWKNGFPKRELSILSDLWQKALKEINAEDIGQRYEKLSQGHYDWAEIKQVVSAWYLKNGHEDPVRKEVREQKAINYDKSVKSEGVTVEESLEFLPYARALASFVSYPATDIPLTISIEGNWSFGKTSFLRMVQEELLSEGKRQVIWFNPWRHDAGESIQGAFLFSLQKQLRKGMRPRRLAGELRLLWYQTKSLLISLVCVVLISALIVWAVSHVSGLTFDELKSFFQKPQGDKESKGGIERLVGISAVIPTIVWGYKTYQKTLRQQFKKAYLKGNELAKIGFAEKASERFQLLLKSFTSQKKSGKGREPLYIIIDDLDRCAAPKAAELLDSLQLLMSGGGTSEEPLPVIFLLGLDREKVAAGVAVKFKDMLPYVGQGLPEKGEEKMEAGRTFGYEYLQKFIGVPFRIPSPSPDNMERYVESLISTATPSANAGLTEEAEASKNQTKDKPTKGRASQRNGVLDEWQDDTSPLKFLKKQPKSQDERDYEIKKIEQTLNFKTALMLAAELLGNNPRRVKQYRNLLSLRVYQAYQPEIGLFEKGVTIEMIAKVLMIELARPTLYRALDESHDVKAYVCAVLRGEEESLAGQNPLNAPDEAWLRGAMNALNQGLTFGLTKADYTGFPSATELQKIFAISPAAPKEEVEISEKAEE